MFSVLLGSFVPVSHAEYIQFTLTASITDVPDEPFDPWYDADIGDIVTIQYLIDSNTEDHADNNQVGMYSFVNLSVTLNSDSQTAYDGFITIFDDYSILHDAYIVVFDLEGGLSGTFRYNASSPLELFDSDALPTDTDWTQFGGDFFGTISNDDFTSSITFQWISFDAVVVPAPVSFFVLLLGLGRLRRRI